jgi:hypothetical protein
MAAPALPEDHGLEQRRPAEIVDMVERRAAADQLPDDVVMPEMRGRDERGAVIDAGDELGARAAGDQCLDHRGVVAHRRDRHGVVALVVEDGGIGARGEERPGCAAVTLEGGDVERRPPVAVAGVDVGAGGREAPDGVGVVPRRRRVEVAIGGDLGTWAGAGPEPRSSAAKSIAARSSGRRIGRMSGLGLDPRTFARVAQLARRSRTG